jgi:hypothetical protein
LTLTVFEGEQIMMNLIILSSLMLLATSGCASSHVGANLDVQLAEAKRQIINLETLRASVPGD